MELTVHVGLWVQAALFEFGLHFGSVPGLDTPGDVVDQTGDRRPIRASVYVTHDARIGSSLGVWSAIRKLSSPRLAAVTWTCSRVTGQLFTSMQLTFN